MLTEAEHKILAESYKQDAANREVSIALAKQAGAPPAVISGVLKATGHGIWIAKHLVPLSYGNWHLIWGNEGFDTYDKSATIGPRGGVKRVRYAYGRPRRTKRS